MSTALKSTLAIAAAAAFSAFGIVSTADAQCSTCGKPSRVVAGKTTASSSTSRPSRTVTQYKDVRRTNYVGVINRHVHTNYVRPHTHVNVITRVHTHTQYQYKTVRSARTVTQPGTTSTSYKTVAGGNTVSHCHTCKW